MWLQRFTHYILAHRWQAIALTFAITFIPVIGTVGILIATLVTLRKNILDGALLTIAATLPFIVSFYLAGHGEAGTPAVFVWAAVSVAVLSNILTWAFAVMLHRQVSWSLILQVAALLGVLVVSVIHLVDPSITNWWAEQLKSYYAHMQTMTGSLKNSLTPSGIEAQTEVINVTKQYATGLMVTGVLFNALLQLVIAAWWQAIIFKPGSLRKALCGIRLSPLAGILFVLSLACSYWGNSVVSDIMPILYVLFSIAGLSLIHYLFGLMTSSTKWFWLLLFYVVMIVLLPGSLVLIAMVALFDVWFDVRKRYKKMS